MGAAMTISSAPAGVFPGKHGAHADNDTKLRGLQLPVQLWPGSFSARPGRCLFNSLFSAMPLKEKAYKPAAMSWR